MDLSDEDLNWISQLLFQPLYQDIHSASSLMEIIGGLHLTVTDLLAAFKRWFLSYDVTVLLSQDWIGGLRSFVPVLYEHSLEEDSIFGRMICRE